MTSDQNSGIQASGLGTSRDFFGFEQIWHFARANDCLQVMTRSYSSPRVLAQHMARFDKPLLTNLAELLKTDEAEILTAHLVALVEVSAPLTFFKKLSHTIYAPAGWPVQHPLAIGKQLAQWPQVVSIQTL
jgi:hypothetical protein